jgi:hypothetical protein
MINPENCPHWWPTNKILIKYLLTNPSDTVTFSCPICGFKEEFTVEISVVRKNT